MTADVTRHRAGQATRAPRNTGRHRPGDNSRDQHGRLLIAEANRKPADWTPTPAWIRAQNADAGTFIPAADPMELTGRLDPSEVTR